MVGLQCQYVEVKEKKKKGKFKPVKQPTFDHLRWNEP